MVSALSTLGGLSTCLLLAQASATPVVILVLCVAAGVGTVLMLPGRREAAMGRIGGVVVLAAGIIAMAVLLRQAAHTFADLYFWVFSFIAIAAALRVITHTRPVYSALYFVLTALASAGLFVLLWAEFLAAALVLIYAGAILVTYVFVIMLAAQAAGEAEEEQPECDRVSREPMGAAAVGFALMGVLLLVIFDKAQGAIRPVTAATTQPTQASPDQPIGSAQQLGQYLFEKELLNLELAGVILTVSMVGAIIIAGRRLGRVAAGPPLPIPGETESVGTAISADPGYVRVDGTTDPKAKQYPEE